jgi:NhaA family Na+:H+ antiporter
MWYFMLNSGIHATITGVLLAFAIPFGNGGEKSPSYILQHILHYPVAFVILPIFALANTAIIISSGWQNAMTETYTLGILFGLLLGKPIGIFVFSYLAVKMKLCSLPSDINWKTIIGVGFLAGIGFTMSIFITILAYNDDSIINNTKIMIIIASSLAGIIGFTILNYFLIKEAN